MNDDPQRNEQEELFIETFGISTEELKRRGIDPGRYAAEHMKSALKDPQKAHNLLPKSMLLMSESRKWSARIYYCLFLAIGVLFVLVAKPVLPVRVVVVAISLSLLALGIWCFSKARGFYRSYKNECRVEGIEIKDMWGRRVNRRVQRVSPDFNKADREFNREKRSGGKS